MKTVVATGFVVEHERSWLFLPCAMAAVEKLFVIRRKWLFGRAQFGRPAIRNFCEVRIGRRAKFFDDFRKRIAEIFVVAFAETVPLHYDMAAKRFFFRKKRGESGALLQIQEWTRRRIAGFGKLREHTLRGNVGDAILYGLDHEAT